MPTQNEALARAIEYTDATFLGCACGHVEGCHTCVEYSPVYAQRDNENSPYYVVDAESMKHLGSALIAGQEDAYSFWCASSDALRMPSWWTPEQPFAWRPKDGGISRLPHHDLDGWDASFDEDLERITADLTTGEEVLCLEASC